MPILEIIPSHQVARWLLVHIHRLLDTVGLEKDKTTEEVIYVAIIVAAALATGWLVSRGLRLLIRRIIDVRSPSLGRDLAQYNVLQRSCRIVAPLVILALVPLAFVSDKSLLYIVVIRVLLVYTVIVVCMAISAVMHFVWMRVERQRNTRNLPLTGILDTIVGVLWVIAAIISVAIIVDKSPAVLLTGLGAFAAVLMLVFKDSILGLVAGLQLSQNDMLHVGDWIVVPSTLANGVVQDVSLTAVKVQNFDNTIVTLPPYTLISGSFQNWRGMSDSGVRQICRSVLVDIYSIEPTTQQMLERIESEFPIVKPYIDRLQAHGGPVYDPGVATVNGTADTNLGLLRAYMCQWLLDNPAISNEWQILVRTLAPTADGLPLQLYCYTSVNAWTAYEAIQSAVFEHLIVTAPRFGLQLYNDTSGADVLTIDTFRPGARTADAPQPPKA